MFLSGRLHGILASTTSCQSSSWHGLQTVPQAGEVATPPDRGTGDTPGPHFAGPAALSLPITPGTSKSPTPPVAVQFGEHHQ